MAVPKHARVSKVQGIGDHTRLLELVMDEPLGFVGGQYVIVDSGRVLENGKAVKRAYSLLGSDREQRDVQLAVRRIPDGLGSDYMHGLEPGAEVTFSGPWGKMYAPEAAKLAPTLVLATDTGITAALGLLSSQRMAGLLDQTVLLWLRVSEQDFVPDAFVTGRVPPACDELRIEALPPIGHPERVPYVRTLLALIMQERKLERAFVAGDGAVNYALLDDLVAGGIAASRDSLESFFNMPKKSPAPSP
jgi:ferredoxin-NADP reductase